MKSIVINADDFGISNEVNRGIALAFDKGLINQTTLMVDGPCVAEAITIAKQHNFFDKVGLHLDLDHLKDDKYKSLIQQVRHRLLNEKEKESIKKDIARQIDKYISYDCSLMHIDSHHHTHVEIQILALVIPIAKSKGFKTMRISRNMMPTIGLKGVGKYVYKHWVNSRIKSCFTTTDFFGSYEDYCKYIGLSDSVEIMVHPILLDNKLYDSIAKNISKEMDYYKISKING